MLPCSLEDGDPIAGIQPKLDPSMPPPTVNNPDRPAAISLCKKPLPSDWKTVSQAPRTAAPIHPASRMTVRQWPRAARSIASPTMCASWPCSRRSPVRISRPPWLAFDAVSVTSITWTGTDELFQGLSNFSNGEQALFEHLDRQGSRLRRHREHQLANAIYAVNVAAHWRPGCHQSELHDATRLSASSNPFCETLAST